MTNNEAKTILENLQRLLTQYVPISDELKEANGRAIKALETQIAKKPIYKQCDWEIRLSHYLCPNCRTINDGYNGYRKKFCPECGQKIDWSDEE